MSDHHKGTIVDFSDDPRSSVFGRNADGEYADNVLGNLKDAAVGNIPFISQGRAAGTALQNAFNPPQSYFHGEWWEALLNAMQAAADIGVQIVDYFDYGKALLTGDLVDIIGSLAAAVCKGLLDWLWSSFQPLQDAVGVLLGNPDKINNSSAMWSAVSENLKALQDGMADGLVTTLNERWDGEAASGAVVRSEDLLNTVGFASQSSLGLSEILAIYADMAERINDTVRQLIADLVSAVVSYSLHIATKGPVSIIPIGIDLAILLARYTLRLIGIAIQEIWFIIAGSQLVNTIKDCFEQAMQVLQKLSGYNGTVSA